MTFNPKSLQDWGIVGAFALQTITIAISVTMAAGRVDTRVAVLEERVGNCIEKINDLKHSVQSIAGIKPNQHHVAKIEAPR